jgi:Holliday junction resolvasome RuvABC endonuclease subunit
VLVVVAELGQQALLETEGPRTVRAPADAGWWGVDPSTLRVAIGWAGPRRGVETKSFPRLRDGERLEAIHDLTRAFVIQLLEDAPAPGVVLVEQPAAYGRQVEPALYYAVGVVQAAVCAQLRVSLGRGVVVETVPVGVWKKHGVGSGAAKKPDVLRWARLNGYEGLLQDEADALAIAEAARRMVRFEP